MQTNSCVLPRKSDRYFVDPGYRHLIIDFAHQIRTPMQAVLNCSKVLEMVPADSLEFQRALAVIVCNMTVQAELVEELLRAAA